MVSINIEKKKDGSVHINCGGHAHFCDGNDIVCAGVSAIVQAFVGAVVNSDVDIDYSMDCGYCKAVVGKGASKELRMLIIGIMQIEKAYPKNVRLTSNIEL